MTERNFRNRLLVPFLIPVGVLVGVGFFIVNLSRVLLAVSQDMAVVVGIGASVIILAGASWAATRPRITRGTLVALMVILALAVGTSGAIAARMGERKIEKHQAGAHKPEHGKSPNPTASPTSPVTGGTTVSGANLAFDPKTLTVSAGTTVTWTMDDALPHTVTSGPGSPIKFDSGNKNRGETFQFTFSSPGTYPYYCIYHATPSGQGMAGTITVT